MISHIKAELYKLISIRSTYALCATAFGLDILYNFYVYGYKIGPLAAQNHLLLMKSATLPIGLQPPILIGSLISILLVAHEYRYNTIMYTLTGSTSRTQVLFSKLLAISIFGILFTFVIGASSPLFTYLGMHLHHLTLVRQTFYYREYIWRVLFFGWAYFIAAFILALLLRSLVISLISIFLIRTTIEPLISLVLKNNGVYLPFTNLDSVVNSGLFGAVPPHTLSGGESVLVFLAYFVGMGSIAWYLFVKRDATTVK